MERNMMRELPIYQINIDDEDCLMTTISLVTSPAIEADFLAFSEQKPLSLSFADEEKHIITGPVCLANTLIYRRDARGEYYIRFSPETIEKMMLKYSQNDLFNSVNLQHDEQRYTEGVKMIEFYVKNSERGISPAEYQDAPEGSLFASFKVLDDDIWRDVKANNINGYSLEIWANLDRVEMAACPEINTEADLDAEVAELLKEEK